MFHYYRSLYKKQGGGIPAPEEPLPQSGNLDYYPSLFLFLSTHFKSRLSSNSDFHYPPIISQTISYTTLYNQNIRFLLFHKVLSLIKMTTDSLYHPRNFSDTDITVVTFSSDQILSKQTLSHLLHNLLYLSAKYLSYFFSIFAQRSI